jgi:hypothetical protein
MEGVPKWPAAACLQDVGKPAYIGCSGVDVTAEQRTRAVYEVAVALSNAAMALVQGGRRAEALECIKALRLHQSLHGLASWRDLAAQVAQGA